MEESFCEFLYIVGEGFMLSEDSFWYDYFFGDDGFGFWSFVFGSESCFVEMEGDSFGFVEYWCDCVCGYVKLLMDSICREEVLI